MARADAEELVVVGPYDPDTNEITVTIPDPDVTPRIGLCVGVAAIVVDRPTGKVLYLKNADLKRAPASTTKMMTGLLAVEAVAAGTVSLTDIVTIQPDVGVEGGGQIGLDLGDTVSLRDLLHMTLLSSSNDAATAVGTYIGGSRAAFIAMMNMRAAQLGLTNTSYVDISGRDPEDFVPGCTGDEFGNPACAHYTTARDLAALARVALNDALFARIVRRTNWTTTTWRDSEFAVPGMGLPDKDPDNNVTLTTTNRLLRAGAAFYPGAYGVKTGTSDRADSNLVSAATKGSQDVIAVVLGSDWDGTPSGDRYSDSRRLLNYGFNALT